MRGETHDGHDHVAAALAAGASAALVARLPAGLPPGAALLRGPDTFEAVGRLATAARARAAAARSVAVTGSAGKTSTKDALRHVLSAQAPTHGAAASFNNHVGVPVTLARLPRDAAFAVYEIGMNHAGEIAPLVRMVRPHVAIVTTVSHAHSGNFADGIDGVARAKSEIFAAGGEAAIVNRDIPHHGVLEAEARRRGFAAVLGFGEHPRADFRLVATRPEGGGIAVDAEVEGRRLSFVVGAPGRHWAMNALAVLAATRALGADMEAAAAALATVAAPRGRGQQRWLGPADRRFLLLDESYNPNPASMRAALDVAGGLAPGAGGRRIAVLGDMLELGAEAPALHAALAAPVEAAGMDLAFTCGPLMRGLHEALPARMRGAHAPDSASLAALVAAEIRAGYVVVVKGSLGSRMQRVVDALVALDAVQATA
ncbi:MAG: UDP-N-acetylmuramoyl-tripeptide--D-alanyl-D-alanine ligase [Alphaproteobacteria bacterium]